MNNDDEQSLSSSNSVCETHIVDGNEVETYLAQRKDDTVLHLEELCRFEYYLDETGAAAVAQELSCPDTRVKELSLGWMRLGLPSATILSIPLLHNKVLEEICLSHSKIGIQGALTIASGLAGSTSHVKLLELDDCDLAGRDVGLVLNVLSRVTSLEKLVLAHNRIGDFGSRDVADLLSTHQGLKDLVLCDCEIEDAGAGMILNALVTNTGLESLDLCRNGIGVIGAEHVGRCLSVNQSLLKLLLSDCRITNAEASFIAAGLSCNTTLHELSLSGNPLGDAGAIAIAGTGSLRKLDMARCDAGLAGFVALTRRLTGSHGPHSLCLDDNHLGIPSVAFVAPSLSGKCMLRDLSLRHCDLCAGLIIAIADDIFSISGLESLDLSQNPINDDGVEAVGSALCGKQSLRKLALCDCSFGSPGMMSLSETIARNTGLAELIMSNNKQVGVDGWTALSKALSSGCHIRKLSLLACGIDGEVATLLARGLTRNLSVQCLEIGFNRFGDVGASALADCLHVNTKLESLYVESSDIGDEGMVALSKSLAANDTLENLNTYANPGLGTTVWEHETLHVLSLNSCVLQISPYWSPRENPLIAENHFRKFGYLPNRASISVPQLLHLIARVGERSVHHTHHYLYIRENLHLLAPLLVEHTISDM